MSVVLHYAVPPGFNLASGKVGLTPTLWSPSAYYSLSLVRGPSGCRVGAGWVGAAVLREKRCCCCRCSSFQTDLKDEKVKEFKMHLYHLHMFGLFVCMSVVFAYISYSSNIKESDSGRTQPQL